MKAVPRPDPARILAGLKDFQRTTVEHVHHRFYLDEARTSRFLVADEVGLGKTLVARGVTALGLDAIWDETERLDVVYICSNAEIAQQNLNRLKVVKGLEYARPTRLTLLPRAIHDLRRNKLNFISLTPGTSFDPHSSMGISQERALLYIMLRKTWDLGRKRGPINFFAASQSADRFKESWVDWLRPRAADEIDAELWERFLADLATEEERLQKADDPTLRERFDDLVGSFQRKERDKIGDWSIKNGQRFLIRDLRALLARSCIEALEPDLVILDEFQRFKHLLDEDTEAGALAKQLFAYVDPNTGEGARTLLLSATPYKAYATSSDPEAESHYEDFIETARFLLDDEAQLDELREALARFRSEILTWDGSTQPQRLRKSRGQIEAVLGRVMARTERLGASSDRNGMLREVSSDARLEAADLAGYLATQRIARAIDQPDTLEYWKSSPYLLNLMDGYKLKRVFQEVVDAGVSNECHREIAHTLGSAAGLLDFAEIDKYKRIDPANARMRWLTERTLGRDAWRLLWLAPSLPYYELSGPFAREGARSLTKHLVFSSWAVVPKAISLLLSYEAERRMTRHGDASAFNSPEERSKRGQLLRITIDKERPTGMPVFGLMYPSFALSELVDPVTLCAEAGEPLTRSEAVTTAAARLRGPLEELTRRANQESNRDDEQWYWAAGPLLDAANDRDRAVAWLGARDLAAEWASGSESAERLGESWSVHIRQVSHAVAAGPSALGKPPDDLAEVLAELALGGPGTVALRALGRGFADETVMRRPEIRMAAAQIAWSFRALFNLPEVSELVKGTDRRSAYWRQALSYCVDSCLQAVIDEFAHILRESEGFMSENPTTKEAVTVAKRISDAVSIRTTGAFVDSIDSDGTRIQVDRHRMRGRFALRFGDQHGEDGAVLARSDHVRTAFNSPFWPFVLATTSVGQEGLDFHQYSHAVVHWNLPSNPVDLEQREGRVHRYKGHAVRRNLANVHGDQVLAKGDRDPWRSLFELGAAERPAGQSELWPFWVYTPDRKSSEQPTAMIERHVPSLPLSRDRRRLEVVRQSLTLYRSVFGQARQEDLLHLLAERVPAERHEEVSELLRIDLTPPERSPLELEERPEPEEVDIEEENEGDAYDGPERGPSPASQVVEHRPAYAQMPLPQVQEAYETGSDRFKALLEELASHPDQPRTYGEIASTLGWERNAVASLFGGYSQRRFRWDDRRPFHYGRSGDGEYWMWVDTGQAALIRMLVGGESS